MRAIAGFKFNLQESRIVIFHFNSQFHSNSKDTTVHPFLFAWRTFFTLTRYAGAEQILMGICSTNRLTREYCIHLYFRVHQSQVPINILYSESCIKNIVMAKYKTIYLAISGKKNILVTKYKTIYLAVTYFIRNNIIPFFRTEQRKCTLLRKRLVILHDQQAAIRFFCSITNALYIQQNGAKILMLKLQ